MSCLEPCLPLISFQPADQPCSGGNSCLISMALGVGLESNVAGPISKPGHGTFIGNQSAPP